MHGELTATMHGELTAAMHGELTAAMHGELSAAMHGELTAAMLGELAATMHEAEAKPKYSTYLQLDLATVEPCVCGPRISGPDISRRYWQAMGFGIPKDQQGKSVPVTLEEGVQIELKHGSVVIASITSCTSALNPSEMLTTARLAKKASERGLQVKLYVKTSLAPGSNVVTKYLEASGLLPALEGQGFYVVGYDYTTCIGSSAEISESVTEAISDNSLVAATVRSCNCTSEGHVHPLFRANYLASLPLVVAYALAGTVSVQFAGLHLFDL
ncbi:unnamed protein product [Closterium sp. Naga37s-1]|nr:unnamed protein product [Closterium sp. Naga37s-1]